MTATYEKIATTTLGSAQASVTFSSISGAYTDLVLIINGTMSTSENSLGMRFNGDTGTNYSTTALYGTGSSAASLAFTAGVEMYVGRSSSANNSTSIIQIQNYSNTTTYKTVLSRGDSPAIVMAQVNLWRNTAAVTTILVKGFNDFANFSSGSTFTLYGIKAE